MSKQVSEKAFFFRNRLDKNLFGFYHRPAENSDKKKGILICNPVFEDRIFAYRFLVNFAREACSKGYHIFRFDYYGYGDSEGDVTETSISSMLTDIKDALDIFSHKVSDICVLGYRMGATLSALFAEKHVNIKKIVLWDPIVKVDKYIQEALRQAISTQTVIFKKILITRDEIINNILGERESVIRGYNLAMIDGYPLTNEMYKQFVKVDCSQISLSEKFIYIAYLVQPKKKINAHQKALYKNFHIANSVTMDVTEESVLFWKDNLIHRNRSEELFEKTLKWLDNN